MREFANEFVGAVIVCSFLSVLWLMFASWFASLNGVTLIGG